MWGLFNRLVQGHDDAEETVTPDSYPQKEQKDDKPCNVSGHNWQPAYSPDFHARSVAFKDRVLKVKKKTHEKCSKCDNYRNQDEWIGKIRITEDGELEVV